MCKKPIYLCRAIGGIFVISEIDKNIIKNNSNLSINQLVELLNFKYTRKQIKNFCYNNNIRCANENSSTRKLRETTKQRNQTPINHNYFKKWSNNMAYILGLWYADGCIYLNKGRGYYFSIKLHQNDKYLLQLILDEMCSQHKIYENRDNSAHITLSSKTIYQDLIALGGKENKSLSIKLPNIPDEYMRDFIRGYFDGDGCVTYNKTQKYYSRCICSGSKIFVDDIYKYLKDNKIIKGSGVYNSKGCTVPRLQFNKKDGIEFEKYIMGNNPSLYLKRKHNLE